MKLDDLAIVQEGHESRKIDSLLCDPAPKPIVSVVLSLRHLRRKLGIQSLERLERLGSLRRAFPNCTYAQGQIAFQRHEKTTK